MYNYYIDWGETKVKIIKIYRHPIYGRCYLWATEFMEYSLGKVDTTYMKFNGYTLEEIEPKILEKGFEELAIAQLD